MYRSLTQALVRIFGTPELMLNKPSWHKDINSGYRTSTGDLAASTQSERLADDGVFQRKLRENMTPELLNILIIRYSDNYALRQQAWQKVKPFIASDTRLPKPLRMNPVLMRLWAMHELQCETLRQHQGKVGIKDKAESTVYRWQQKCRQVCREWVLDAEDEAEGVLEQAGGIKFE